MKRLRSVFLVFLLPLCISGCQILQHQPADPISGVMTYIEDSLFDEIEGHAFHYDGYYAYGFEVTGGSWRIVNVMTNSNLPANETSS